MGKQVYLTDDQIQLIHLVLAPGNFSCETGDKDFDKKTFKLRDQIIEKLEK